MVGTRNGTNTYGKEKKNVKKTKKMSTRDNKNFNAHGVCIKFVVIGRIIDGPTGGFSLSNVLKREKERN